MANAWGAWVAILGGIIALIGQWMTGAWLAAIGGIVAIIGGIGALTQN